MAKTWIITDTHWNHENIKKYENRPGDFNERILKNWWRIVGEDDLIYHLGDVIFDRASELKGILKSMPGTKILVRGGHDQRSYEWYRDKGFAAVMESVVVGVVMAITHKKDRQKKRVLLSHRPQIIHGRVDYNIHGHTHRPKEEWPARKHYLLVLEEVGYRPVRLDRVFLEGTVVPSGLRT